MIENRAFVFLSNKEYTRRIIEAHNIGYNAGRNDSIRPSIVMISRTNVKPTTETKTTTKKGNTKAKVKVKS